MCKAAFLIIGDFSVNWGYVKFKRTLDHSGATVYNGTISLGKGRTVPTISLNTALFIALWAAVVILAILLGIALGRINHLTARIRSFTAARAGEDDIVGYTRDDLSRHLGQINHQLTALNMAQQRGLSRVGLVRFNPYDDTGGDLSFSLALATNEGNGVLITSLHGRGNSRIYAKSLQKWNSSYNLSAEEADALHRAQEG
ncbi:MAG: DUF4446 family protein [Anaerolineae bacterium]